MSFNARFKPHRGLVHSDSLRGVRLENENKACFWIISALEASKWFQITYSNFKNVQTSISERFGQNFGQIKHFLLDVAHDARLHTN